MPQSIRFHPAMNLEHPANASLRNTAQHVFAEMQRCPHLFDLPMIRSQLEQTHDDHAADLAVT